jgi:hypothetical protein
MTFTYDLTKDIGKVRLLIQDTDISSSGAKAVFSDEEITFFLTVTAQDSANNLYLAAAHALEVNATEAARLAKRKRIDVLSNDTTEIAKQLLMLADRYKQKAAELTDIAEPWSTSVVDFAKWAASLLELGITGTDPETDAELLADLLEGSDA